MNDTTILIVDDEPVILASMSKVLAPSYRVRAANSGERVLQVVATDPRPDLILLDVLMPGMDGYSVLSWLKENPDTRDIPVIFVTAMEAEQDEEKGLALGAVDYITKPIKPAILLARVKTQLILKQARDFLHDKNAYLEAEVASRMEDERVVLKALHDSELRFRNLFEHAEVSIWNEDLTEVVRALKQLRIEGVSDLREHLIDNPQVALDIAASVKVLHVNEATLKLFGATSEEQFLSRIDTTFGRGSIEIFIEELCALWERKNVFRAEVAFRTFDDRDITCIVSFQIPETAKEFASVSVSILDITERKQVEQQLRHSQKMDTLGQLTGGVAHDYNNMLGVVLGYANLLEDALSDQPKLAKYAQQIQHAGQRGCKLTRKLLSFSRQKVSDSEQLSINALLHDQQHMLEKILTARVKLVLELAEDLWPVWIDVSDLEDAILNLSINAMHAMEAGGQLTIQTRNETVNKNDVHTLQLDEGDYVALSIIDTGCGMNEETQAKIFEPFFSTKGEKGTGLGLSQVYGFVERSGGTIRVYSEAEQGTRFVLYFPWFNDSGYDNKSGDEDNAVDFSGNETILVVDDEPALLHLTSERLSQHGYKVLCTERGKEALKILEHESIDLLFSDIIMPDMDGYNLATIVQEKYPAVKIQLTSGFEGERYMDIDDEKMSKNLLRKPYDLQVLMYRIRKLLDE
jgi:CheY-like chemotaxis protein